MPSTKYKTLAVFSCALMVYFVLALQNGAPFNEDMIYSLFMYCLGIYCFMPVVNGKPMQAPYSGTVLVKGEDSMMRGFFAFIFLIISVLGLSFVL